VSGCFFLNTVYTQHCRHVHSHWSRVFNLLKFDRIAKKKKRPRAHFHEKLFVCLPIQSRVSNLKSLAQVVTARCTLVQSAVLRSHVVCLSVCLSVRLSMTLVDCDHIGWNSSKIISPLVSLGRSLFATPT